MECALEEESPRAACMLPLEDSRKEDHNPYTLAAVILVESTRVQFCNYRSWLDAATRVLGGPQLGGLADHIEAPWIC